MVIPGNWGNDVLSRAGITLAQFLEWNPDVNSGTTNLIANCPYCIQNDDGGDTIPIPHQPGIRNNYPKYKAADVNECCCDMSQRYGISLTDFLS
jgi:hypothetical protein